jgi:uncharacterized protein (TIGR02271 family)
LAGDETRVAAFPVVEERLRIDKTVSESDRVFIRTSVLERTEYAELDLHSGQAVIERLAVNRVVDAPPAIRQEGDTIVVPVVEEIMVVEKRLLLKEEIRIRRHEVVEHIRQPVRLRSEEVSLERDPSLKPNSTTAEEE